jgi:MoaA/NifB/PqqE/SkfB family radical SAM enzyme
LKRKLLRKTKPYKLTLEVTRKCNSKCATCGIWKEFGVDSQVPSNILTVEEYGKMAKKAGKDLLWLNITGGEPFLREDLKDIISVFIKHCPNLCLVNIPTNGILPNKIIHQLREVLSLHKITLHITVSLDGLKEQQDRIRGIQGMFQKSIKTYEKLLTLKSEFPSFKVSFETTLSSLNSENIEEIMDYAQPLSDTYILTFTQISPFYNNTSLRIERMNQTMLDAMKRIRSKYTVRRIEDLFPKVFIILSQKFLKSGISPLKCSAGRSSVTIDWTGNISPCLFLGKNIINVRDNSYNPFDLPVDSPVLIEASHCRKCWINCEAIPTMLDNGLRTVTQVLKND